MVALLFSTVAPQSARSMWKIIKQVKSLAYNHVAHGAVDAGMKISRFEVCVLVVVLLDEHEPVRQSLNEAG